MKIFNKEGYEYASIKGDKLNIRTDFKVWCGIIMAFSKYGYNTETISLRFSEFIKLCGFKPQMSNSKFRLRIQESLARISSQTLDLKAKKSVKGMSTHLLKKCYYDASSDSDIIMLEGDSDLWELYQLDRQILVNVQTLNAIPRFETAQCLYLFFVSLPANPLPVTISRMKERLSLKMSNKEVNRTIKSAIKRLEDINYLSGGWCSFNNEDAYQIYDRDRCLGLR